MALINTFDSLARWVSLKAEMYFNGLDAAATTFDGSLIIDCHFLEELAADSDDPLGVVSSNEVNMKLRNVGRKFTPTNTNSPFHGKMGLGIPCKLYMGIKQAGNWQWVFMGTYYTCEWQTNETDVTVTVVMQDKLSQWAQVSLRDLLPQRNIKANDYIAYVLKCAGFKPNEFVIDTAINHTLTYGWVKGKTLLKVLSELSRGLGCYIYMGRDDKLYVQKMFKQRNNVHTLHGATNIQKTDVNYTILNNYTGATVNVNHPTTEMSSQIASLDNLVVPPHGELVLTDVEYTRSPILRMAYARVSANTNNLVEVRRISPRTWDCDVVLYNPTGAEQVCSLKLFGDYLEDSYTAYHSNKESQNVLQVKESLIQDENFAKQYCADIAKALNTENTPRLKIAVRGNPLIQLGQQVHVDSTTEFVNVNLLITRSELSYDGGLSGTIEGLIAKEGN